MYFVAVLVTVTHAHLLTQIQQVLDFEHMRHALISAILGPEGHKLCCTALLRVLYMPRDWCNAQHEIHPQQVADAVDQQISLWHASDLQQLLHLLRSAGFVL